MVWQRQTKETVPIILTVGVLNTTSNKKTSGTGTVVPALAERRDSYDNTKSWCAMTI